MKDEVEIFAAGRFVQLRRCGRWEYATRPDDHGVVAIVPVTPEGEFVLVEQFRVPVQRRVVEWPAGLAGDGGHAGERLVEAARRELEEETGYRAATWRELATLHASAGLTDEAATLFLATGLERAGAGGGVEGEDIEIHRVPRAEIFAWLSARAAAGRAIDGRVYAGLALEREADRSRGRESGESRENR